MGSCEALGGNGRQFPARAHTNTSWAAHPSFCVCAVHTAGCSSARSAGRTAGLCAWCATPSRASCASLVCRRVLPTSARSCRSTTWLGPPLLPPTAVCQAVTVSLSQMKRKSRMRRSRNQWTSGHRSWWRKGEHQMRQKTLWEDWPGDWPQLQSGESGQRVVADPRASLRRGRVWCAATAAAAGGVLPSRTRRRRGVTATLRRCQRRRRTPPPPRRPRARPSGRGFCDHGHGRISDCAAVFLFVRCVSFLFPPFLLICVFFLCFHSSRE